MAKTSSQMKTMIEEYIKTTGQTPTDSTTKAQNINKDVEWQLIAGRSLHFTKMKNRDDRINIEFALGFDPKILSSLTVGKPELEQILMEMNKFAISSDLKIKWNVDNGTIKSFIVQSYIDVDDITRSNVFEKWDRIATHGNFIGARLTIFANPKQSATAPEPKGDFFQ